MGRSPFHAYYIARTLSGFSYGRDKLLPVFASSNIKIYPFQIAAARFALRSPYLKGCILCDDGSIGKSFEAMLVITQMWYEGKNRLLAIVPTPLRKQWENIVEERFSVPVIMIDNNPLWNEQIEAGKENPFEQEGLVITTYDFAVEKAAFLSEINWHMTILDEAHHLRKIYKQENSSAETIKNAVKNSFKLLLTATPMQTDIMDLYGLIYFIDEEALPDADSFYKRYFRKPENYGELTNRVSKFCFRTLRTQVSNYVKIPSRIPITIQYIQTQKEQQLSRMIDDYLAHEYKYAFTKMELYDLKMMFFHLFSSSTAALLVMLKNVEKRLQKLANETDNQKISMEHAEISSMIQFCEGIKENGKTLSLLTVLKKGFVRLKQLKAQKKAIIFTENRATQKYLFHILSKGEYRGKVLPYSGESSRDYAILERFEKEAEILITTDIASEGFNLEYCSFIINYDLPYNALKIEQRINRCHRQEQQFDVLVVHFLDQNNFADVRLLELINKRILQFDGIMGSSDDIIGNFCFSESEVEKVMLSTRTKEEIQREFDNTLNEFEQENKKTVKSAEEVLFSTFHQEISTAVTITPQYIENRIKKINDDLWALTKYFFQGKEDYSCDDETRTLHIGYKAKNVFTGVRLGRREYSMTDKTLPKSGWHTLTGTLAKNMMSEIFWKGIPDKGSITVSKRRVKCTIAYYQIKVKQEGNYLTSWDYYVLIGKNQSGQIMSHEECEQVMELPVLKYQTYGDTYGERDGLLKEKNVEELDCYIKSEEYIKRTLSETDEAMKEEIEAIKTNAADKKLLLVQTVEELKDQSKFQNEGSNRIQTITEKLLAEKKKATVQKELKKREQQLFLDSMRLDVEMKQKIKQLTEAARLTAEVKRQFIITVNGG